MLRYIKWILFVVILAGFIWFIRETDLHAMSVSLQKIGWGGFGLILLSTFLAYLLATIGWRFCLPKTRYSILQLFMIRHIGEVVTLINPTSIVGGEATKWTLMNDEQANKKEVAVSIMVSRMILIYTQLICFGIVFIYTIKAHRPDLHVKAFTPVELDYMFRKAKVSVEEGMRLAHEAGLDSLPGGGAEIFHPEIRKQICEDKVDADGWLHIHKTAHQLGMHSNATLLYGHIEQFWHRIDHMERLRQLQDETGGFNTFIPLKFRNKDNDMSHIPESSVVEDMRMYAVSRLYMDNFPHIKAYWPMLGRQNAQLTLSFGVNDIDGTIDDSTKIYAMAGSEEQTPTMSTEELVRLIKQVNRQPVERGTLYNEIKDYSESLIF